MICRSVLKKSSIQKISSGNTGGAPSRHCAKEWVYSEFPWIAPDYIKVANMGFVFELGG
jgi:hypothetical protein